jgi:hypothetical protein
MAITTLGGYLDAPKYYITYRKASFGANNSSIPVSVWTGTGSPGAGGAVGNTTTGVVPTDATTGAVEIPDFSGQGYITRLDFAPAGSVVGNCRYRLYDRLWHAGNLTVSSVATTSFSSQPSFSSRVPGGDYSGLQIFIEQTTGGGTASTVTVTYTNEAGVTGQVSESVSLNSSGQAGNVYRVPLAAGDRGVQTIEAWNVTSSGSSATYNVVVARHITTLYQRGTGAESAVVMWLDRLGARYIYNDSCLWVVGKYQSSNALPAFDMEIEIASG